MCRQLRPRFHLARLQKLAGLASFHTFFHSIHYDMGNLCYRQACLVRPVPTGKIESPRLPPPQCHHGDRAVPGRGRKNGLFSTLLSRMFRLSSDGQAARSLRHLQHYRQYLSITVDAFRRHIRENCRRRRLALYDSPEHTCTGLRRGFRYRRGGERPSNRGRRRG